MRQDSEDSAGQSACEGGGRARSGRGRARTTYLPSQQEGRPSVGSHASTWAQLVKCTRVEGVTLQRIHVPVLTPSRGCKQEQGARPAC